MEDLLAGEVIVEQIADRTEVPGELNLAFLALFLTWLHGLTVQAANLLHSMPVDLMVLLWVHLRLKLHLIMAQPAGEKLKTLRTLELASPPVMLAPELRIA